jgi:integrase
MNNIEKNPLIEKWLRNVAANSRKGYLTENTKRNYLSWFSKFLEFTKETPEKLIEEAKGNTEKAKNRITDFYGYLLKKGIHPNAASAMAYGGVRGFYVHNGILFGKWRLPGKSITKVSEVDARYEAFKYDDETKEIYVDTELLQAFMNNLNFRDKVIALCLLSTGQDASDLFKLNVGFVRKQSTKRLFWQSVRNKTGEPFKVFFSEEATRYLRRYIDQERKGAADDEPLFVVTPYEYKRKARGKIVKVKVGGRMQPHLLAMDFREAQRKMGIVEDGNHSPFRPKRFRHIFRTACTRAGLDEGYIYVFMGHKTSISQGYLEKDRAILEAQYVKVEPFVTVFKSEKAEEIVALRKQVEEDKERLQRLVNGLTEKTLGLEQELKNTHHRLQQMEKSDVILGRLIEALVPLIAPEQYKALVREIGLAKNGYEIAEHLKVELPTQSIEEIKREAGTAFTTAFREYLKNVGSYNAWSAQQSTAPSSDRKFEQAQER